MFSDPGKLTELEISLGRALIPHYILIEIDVAFLLALRLSLDISDV